MKKVRITKRKFLKLFEESKKETDNLMITIKLSESLWKKIKNEK